MSIGDLLTLCNLHGVRLVNVQGELKLRGPEGAITAEVVAGAEAHKPSLLAFLPPEPIPSDRVEIPLCDVADPGTSQPGEVAVEEREAIAAEGNGEITPTETLV